MKEIKGMTAVLVDEGTTYTIIEVCERLNVSEDLINEMEAQGLFAFKNETRQVSEAALMRIESACRIHQDLGVNLAGVVLALELLDELDDVKQQLAILKRNLK